MLKGIFYSRLDWRKVIGFSLALIIVTEIALLEIKYQIISGEGFLQSAPLTGGIDKSLFVFFYIGSIATLYFLFTNTYRFIAFKIGQGTSRAAFTAGTLFTAIYGVAILVIFQLHRYLADHVEMAVVKEIAGGSMKTAISYASNEITFFLLPILIILALFIWLYRRVREDQRPHRIRKKRAIFMLSGFFIAFIALEIEGSQSLKLNLNRAIGYSWLKTIAHNLADFDGDGSSVFTLPRDLAPFDKAIHWGAIDIPANGIDENGLGGDLPIVTENNSVTESYSLPNNYKHLIVVVSESTRADIIGKTINGKLVAPFITELAKSGSSANRAYSHTGFTSSSLYSLFSGRYNYRVGTPSVFDDAKAAGFEISIISGQDETWGGLDHKLNTRKNASFFYDPQDDPDKRVFPSRLASSIKLTEADLLVAFEHRLKEINWNSRQFFYLNFQAGHFPYSHKKMPLNFIKEGIPRSEISISNKEWLRKTYWNSMANVDTHLKKLVDDLITAGVWEETLLIFLGDHGESLFHDGSLGHGQSINDDQLRIPLVLSAPGMNFKTPIGLTDINNWLRSFIKSSSPVFEKKGNCVLMYTGNFKKPGQIGNACTETDELRVYTVNQNQFSGQNGDSEKNKLALIHSWENALYNTYKSNKN